MHFSPLRALQWLGIALFVAATVGLTYDFESEASKTVNAPVENRLSQGLLGYWKMDEGTGTSTTADASGNANNLTMTAMESGDWVAGQIGAYALDFDGSAEWLTVADPASGVLDIVDGADFTITGWFNRDLFAADHTIVAKKTNQTTNAGYVVWVDNNGSTDYLNFELSDGTDTYTAAGATDLSATGWHHFAAVWNDNTGMYIYLDGRLDGSTTTSTSSINSLANANAFRIGAESDDGVPFDGKIDDIKLYGKALSEDAVKRLYQTTVPGSPVDTGLVGHWTFDGPDVIWGDTSNEVKDVSGKGNHGDASGLTASSAVIGKLGQGLQFNGTSDYVNVPDNATLDFTNGQDFSISGWFKRNDNADWKELIRKRGDGTDGYDLVFASGNLWMQISSSGGAYTIYSYATIPVGEWVNFVFVWDDDDENNTIFYINGLVTSTYRPGGFSSVADMSNSNSLRIGASYDGGGLFKGLIDDVRIYNRALSATEVANLYNMGK